MVQTKNTKIHYFIKYILALVILGDLAFFLLIRTKKSILGNVNGLPIEKVIGFFLLIILFFIFTKYDKLFIRKNKSGRSRLISLLNNLPKRFIVINKQNTDVIIGPTGIYCLLALDWQGEIKNTGMEWLVNGKPYMNPVPVIMEFVQLINDKIKTNFDKTVSIKPVIVLTEPEVKIKGSSFTVPIIKYKMLPKFLNSNLTGPGKLDLEEIKRLATLLK